MSTFNDTDHDRFWTKVYRRGSKECWPWLGRLNKDGYGGFDTIGHCWLAHRVAWILTNGAIPIGKIVRHRCDTPGCCNPRHLRLGTNVDNVKDMLRRKRHRALKGSKNGSSKLHETQVAQILGMFFVEGLSRYRIAKLTRVSETNIGSIVARKTWKHVGVPSVGSHKGLQV